MTLFISLIIAVILIVMINSFRNETTRQFSQLGQNIDELKRKVNGLKTEEIIPKPLPKVEKAPIEIKKAPPVVQPKPIIKEETPVVKPVIPKPVEKEEIPCVKPVERLKSAEHIKVSVPKTAPSIATVQPTKETTPKPARDYEKLIGENWLNKIGIAILVIGVGFFVKYAIDKNWIGEWGRVLIGIGTGGLLIGVAHALRRKYMAFSSVLIGGGISIMYYTISIAYHEYGLFAQPVAFLIMVLITLFSVGISIIYDRKELAIIALIGAFTTPFMVKGETNNYVTCFTYITIINTGMLMLSYFKKWNIIGKLALYFTVLFFGGWLFTVGNLYGSIEAKWGLFFVHVFFILFLGMTLLYNISKKVRFNAWEIIQFSAITILYYTCSMFLLPKLNATDWQGTLTILIASFFFVLFIIVRRFKQPENTISILLLGKAISFITLAGALMFDGNYMTIFWGIEGIVLLVVAQKSNLKMLKNVTQLVSIIAFIGFAKDMLINTIYPQNNTPIFNSEFLSYVFVLGALYAIFVLIKRNAIEGERLLFPMHLYRSILGGAIFLGLYLASLQELTNQIRTIEYKSAEILIIWLFHFVFISVTLIIANMRKSIPLQQLFFVFGTVCTLLYLLFANGTIISIRSMVILNAAEEGFFYMHYVVVLFLIGLMYLLHRAGKAILPTGNESVIITAALAIAGIVLASFEMDHIAVFNYASKFSESTILRHTQTEGYTVLWGICSLVIMVIGMRKQWRTFRLLALAIFTVALLKLFTSDIQNITEAGKIIAFISLGVLLLIVSFLYQKLKKLIVDGKVD